MKWQDHKRELLKDPETAREYDALTPEYELADSLIGLRLAKGMTQRQLAEKIGTKQSSISRLESMDARPSLRFLERVAAALDAHVVVRLEPKMKIPVASAPKKPAARERKKSREGAAR